MNRFLPLVPVAAAALILPALAGGRHSEAEAAAPPVPRAQLLAAVAQAEAQRKAAAPARALPTGAAASLDRLSGTVEKLDPNQIDPGVLGALAH